VALAALIAVFIQGCDARELQVSTPLLCTQVLLAGIRPGAPAIICSDNL
jgi:hypothetical protein